MSKTVSIEKTTKIRSVAQELFQEGVAAANPEHAMGLCLQNNAHSARCSGRLIVIAIGKAAIPMMRGALACLGDREDIDALVVTNYENSAVLAGVEVLLAGHPVPDENGVIAAKAVMRRLEKAGAQDRVVALISGGASALLPAPVEGVSLADKACVNKLLMQSGFEITETNLVRQQLSQLKGGKFNALASPAPVCAYILSDVIGDDFRVIASGPTASAIADRKAALELLGSDQIKSPVPAAVLNYLRGPQAAARACEAENFLIGSNNMSVQAVAERASALGWQVTVVDSSLTGDVVAAAEKVAAHIQAAPVGRQSCLLFGGETSVHVTGSGKGGRNQELALRVAIACASRRDGWVFLSGGTDGRDGPTDAAGGVVDAESMQRVQSAGVDVEASLRNSDSYHVLEVANDLLITGATGTNVADIQIALIP